MDWADARQDDMPPAGTPEGDEPPMFGGDERRMQVRAYHFWTRLLGDTNFPLIAALDPDDHPDFAPNSVLLDFSSGIDNPAVSFLGALLAEECGGSTIRSLADVPPRSLLSRITDHYLQIIANRAPIGFEAEYENQHGAAIMYRGILLPFSSDGDTIDHIYGVINWKERASGKMAAELQLEVANAIAQAPRIDSGHAIWADGPDAPLDDVADDAAMDAEMDMADGQPGPDDGLADWLASARRLADAARGSEGRSRAALYAALGRAYDVAIVAADEEDTLQALLDDAGIKAQARAPMTAIAKLVFGAGYDKARLTEFSAALTHAARSGVALGGMPAWIDAAEGGLKGIVRAAREARRADTPAPVRADPRAALRHAPAIDLAAMRAGLDEFVLLVARATDDGGLAIVGRATATDGIMDRALRSVTR
jgi:hypothetical protein